MKCNCTERIEDKLNKSNENGYFNFKITTAAAGHNNALAVVPYIEITFDKKTKSGKIVRKKDSVAPTFCPWCGSKLTVTYEDQRGFNPKDIDEIFNDFRLNNKGEVIYDTAIPSEVE